MYFELDSLSEKNRYKLLVATVVPRPIALVVTQSKAGGLNAAPFSWFNVVSSEPPVVVLGIATRLPEARAYGGASQKDTFTNIIETGEFVVNLVNEDVAAQANMTEGDFAPHINELDKARLTTSPSTNVKPPRISDSPVALECQTMKIISLTPTSGIVLGRVLAIYVADECMLDAEKFYIDTPKLNLVGRMHASGWYAKTTDLFHLDKISSQFYETDSASAPE